MLKTKNGFTIVELLIVLVVIGVLATITIVAYNGVQNRARASSASAALTQAAKKLSLYQVDNSAYPTTLSAAGVSNTSDVSYQYRTTSTGYCLTATSGTISYKATESSPPSQGGCTLSNLALNPSFETNLTGWGTTYVGAAGATLSRVTSGAGITSGSAALEVTVNTQNAAGFSHQVTGILPGTPYTASAYITLVSGDSSLLMLHTAGTGGTWAYTNITPLLSVGETRRINLAFTSNSNVAANNVNVTIMRNGVSTGSAVVRLDGLMVDQGMTTNAYADGNSAGWTWSGTANNSASSGPPL